MNRIVFGIVIGVLAVAAVSPTALPRIATALRSAEDLRAVRIAETEQERKDAVAALTEKVRTYDLAVAAE